MANVGTLSIKFTGDARQLEQTFTKIGVKANLAASVIEGVFKTAVRVGSEFVQSSVQIAAKNEAVLVSFQNLTGSIGTAKDLYQDLIEFSSTTPFSFDQVSQGTTTLLGFGLSADDATKALKDLGAAAASNADTDLKRLVTSYGQIQGANVAMTKDLREFVNNGIPIYNLLSDTLGVSTAKINDMASAGEITGDVITRVFREAAIEGGRFSETLLSQSKTLDGLSSTMKDNYAITLGKIGQNLLPAAKEAAIGFNDVLLDLQDYFESDAGVDWGTNLAATVRATFETAGREFALFQAKMDLINARLYIGTRDTYNKMVDEAKNAIREIEANTTSFNEAFQAAVVDIGFERSLEKLQGIVDFIESPTSSGGSKKPKIAEDLETIGMDAFKASEELLAFIKAQNDLMIAMNSVSTGLTDGNIISDEEFRKRTFNPYAGFDTSASLSGDVEEIVSDDKKEDVFKTLGKLGELGDRLKETFTDAFATIGDGLIDIVTGTKSIGKAWSEVGNALKNIFRDLIKQITKMLAKTLAFTLLGNLLSGGGLSLAGFGKNFNKLFLPSFHDGGRMPHDGLAYLHEGEIITNPKLGQRTPGSSTTVYVRGVEYGADTYWKNANANVLGTLINGL